MSMTQIDCPTHERVYRVTEPEAGLHAIIALHSTRRGPAAGGLRMRRYASEADALDDALRLSRGMTYKNAAADLPLGGGKSVILGDPATEKTETLLKAFGRAVAKLGGAYWTAEDMGMSPEDMAVIRTETEFVAGLDGGDFASGDPSPITAEGIFNAIRTTARHRFGSSILEDRRIAVQGLGHVGWHVVKLLKAAGADIVVGDIDPARTAQVVESFAVEGVDADKILAAEADILAPCAIGGILNEDTIPSLRVGAIAGGANNQLATLEDGDLLHARGILYAPDYVANGGGIINAATEMLKIEDREHFVQEKLSALDATLDRILTEAAARDISPARLADETVEAGLRLDGPAARAAS